MSADSNREEKDTENETPQPATETPQPATETPQSKKREKGTALLYELKDNQVKRLRPTCERCGPGFFMARHQDRYTCGHCGFTRYKTAEQ
jgi:small subunit ribosomal protein S27Ae